MRDVLVDVYTSPIPLLREMNADEKIKAFESNQQLVYGFFKM